LWDEYETRKIEFVRGVTEDQGSSGIDDDLDDSIRKMTAEGATQREIGDRLGIAHSTVSKRLHQKV
jgi:IS30 family transposase